MLRRTVRSLRAKGFRETCAVVPAALVETTSAAISAPIRRRYSQRIRKRDLAPVTIGEPIDLSVMSFVQESDVPELVASVRSFLVHVGVPKEFIVVSDGTITPESRDLIDSILPGVLSVQSAQAYLGAFDVPRAVRDFMANSAWGAKLASIMALNDRTPALYADSDLWYFLRAQELREVCAGDTPLYMQDIAPFLDERLLSGDSIGDQTEVPLNAGFLFVPNPLDWTESSARLAALSGEPIGDTEQAAAHLTFRLAGGRPFPPTRYVVNPRRTKPRLVPRGEEPCVRHYTRPQRGLFWLEVARFEALRRREQARSLDTV